MGVCSTHKNRLFYFDICSVFSTEADKMLHELPGRCSGAQLGFLRAET